MEKKASPFLTAIGRFDALNRLDPNSESFEGKKFPKEYLYSKRMTAWLKRLAPNASEALRLAARSQHIARWQMPRSDYSMDRRGYLAWRTNLNKFHATKASEILREVGYDAETIMQVEGLLLKKRLKHNPEMQVLEDVICLVFLESYLSDFSKKQGTEKLIAIIQKTWKKMSDQGHEAALTLDLSLEVSDLIKSALAQ